MAVSFLHDQNIIWSQTQYDDIEHEQTIILAIICRLRGRLSADEKEEKFASNDDVYYSTAAFHYI